MNFHTNRFLLLFLIPAMLLMAMLWISTGAANQIPVSGLDVSMDTGEVETFTGDSFKITSTITNISEAATTPLIANLTFVSLDGAYVDPEDWSPRRTITIDPIGPGESIIREWTINPVLKGEVGVYVGVLSETGAVAASPAVQLHVKDQRSLNPEGVLPVVAIVPLLIAAAFVGLQIFRRWSTRSSG